jgi:transcriptional regulator with XRE-family HTH domain
MSTETGSRIAELRKKLELTQAQFAERIGLKFSVISMIELGKVSLTEANIRLVCLTFCVQESWLRSGIGEMFDEDAELSSYEKCLIGYFKQLSPKARRMLIEYAEKLLSDEAEFRRDSLLTEIGKKTG